MNALQKFNSLMENNNRTLSAVVDGLCIIQIEDVSVCIKYIEDILSEVLQNSIDNQKISISRTTPKSQYYVFV